jgi:hypothetical protein
MANTYRSQFIGFDAKDPDSRFLRSRSFSSTTLPHDGLVLANARRSA